MAQESVWCGLVVWSAVACLCAKSVEVEIGVTVEAVGEVKSLVKVNVRGSENAEDEGEYVNVWSERGRVVKKAQWRIKAGKRQTTAATKPRSGC